MGKGVEIDREEFLNLPTDDIRNIVLQKSKPRVGVFVADGNRRLVMSKTGLDPTSDAFYCEYAHIFSESLKQSLAIFFDHGLRYLFFPLFGPSLLKRKKLFQAVTIPAVYKEIFQSEDWFRFYRDRGIRLKAYGDLSQLAKIDIHDMGMAAGILKAVETTAPHSSCTLLFGFSSDNTPGFEMPQQIVDFYKRHHRTPTHDEMLAGYYGEAIPPADFIILTNKLSLRALPPLVSFNDTKLYFLPTPGFYSLTPRSYKTILYDLLCIQSHRPPGEYAAHNLDHIDKIRSHLEQFKETVIGTGEKIGDLTVTRIDDPG